MSKPNSAMGRSRDFGLPGGPGKGDSDRTTNRTAFNENLAEVRFEGNVPGFRKVGLKLVKVYGKPAKEIFHGSPWQMSACCPEDGVPMPPIVVPFVENETEWKHIPDNLPPRAEVDLGGKVVNQIPVTNDILRE